MDDEILAELWEAKDRIAQDAGYDTSMLLSRLADAQKTSPRAVANFSKEPSSALSGNGLLRTPR